jgi:hypothetical protein
MQAFQQKTEDVLHELHTTPNGLSFAVFRNPGIKKIPGILVFLWAGQLLYAQSPPKEMKISAYTYLYVCWRCHQ